MVQGTNALVIFRVQDHHLSLPMTRTLQALKLGTLAAISVGGLLAGQAHAANPCFLSALTGSSTACDSVDGDFEVTLVSVSGFTPSATDLLGYTLSGNDLQAQLNFVPGRTTPITNATLVYTITLKNSRTFDTAQANITGNNGTFSTSTTANTGLPSAATSTGGAGSTVSFTPGLSTLTFTQTFASVANGNLVLNSLGTIYSTAPGLTPPGGGAGVPGPLPILGAGAAFGFSRRLRNRIKVAA
jgi:hypothetical protein